MPRSRSHSRGRQRRRSRSRSDSRSNSRSPSSSASRSFSRSRSRDRRKSRSPDRRRGGSGGYRTPVKRSRDRSSDRRGSGGRRDGSRGRRSDSRDDRRSDFGRGSGDRGRASYDEGRRSNRGGQGSGNRDRGSRDRRGRSRSEERNRERPRDRGYRNEEKEDRSGGWKDRGRDRDRDGDGGGRDFSRRERDSNGRREKEQDRNRSYDGEQSKDGGRSKDQSRARSRDRDRDRDRSRDGDRSRKRDSAGRKRDSSDRGKDRGRRPSPVSDDSRRWGGKHRSRSSRTDDSEDSSDDDGSSSDSDDSANARRSNSRDRKRNSGRKDKSRASSGSGGRPPKPPPPAMKDSRQSAGKKQRTPDEPAEKSQPSAGGNGKGKNSKAEEKVRKGKANSGVRSASSEGKKSKISASSRRSEDSSSAPATVSPPPPSNGSSAARSPKKRHPKDKAVPEPVNSVEKENNTNPASGGSGVTNGRKGEAREADSSSEETGGGSIASEMAVDQKATVGKGATVVGTETSVGKGASRLEGTEAEASRHDGAEGGANANPSDTADHSSDAGDAPKEIQPSETAVATASCPPPEIEASKPDVTADDQDELAGEHLLGEVDNSFDDGDFTPAVDDSAAHGSVGDDGGVESDDEEGVAVEPDFTSNDEMELDDPQPPAAVRVSEPQPEVPKPPPPTRVEVRTYQPVKPPVVAAPEPAALSAPASQRKRNGKKRPRPTKTASSSVQTPQAPAQRLMPAAFAPLPSATPNGRRSPGPGKSLPQAAFASAPPAPVAPAPVAPAAAASAAAATPNGKRSPGPDRGLPPVMSTFALSAPPAATAASAAASAAATAIAAAPNGKRSPGPGKGGGKDRNRGGGDKKARAGGAAGVGREGGAARGQGHSLPGPSSARRNKRAAAVVAAGKIKSTSEGGGGASAVGAAQGLLNGGEGFGDGRRGFKAYTGLGNGGPLHDDSEEEATLDGLGPPRAAMAPWVPTVAPSRPKLMGPPEWVMARNKVAELIALDRDKVYTSPPVQSIGKGADYNAYLAMVTTPYWLKQIQKKIGDKKLACSYKNVDEFLHDVRRLCANSFLYMRRTHSEVLLSFLRKLEAEEVKRILTPSKPLVPQWERSLALLDKLYGLGDTIYFFSYPMKVYYIASPEGEPADFAEKVRRPVSMATVVMKLLNGDYEDEGGMVADLRLMVENCKRYYSNNPTYDEETIRDALANAGAVNDALEVGVKELLPEWHSVAPAPTKSPQPTSKASPTPPAALPSPTKSGRKSSSPSTSKVAPPVKIGPSAYAPPNLTMPPAAVATPTPVPATKPSKAKQEARAPIAAKAAAAVADARRTPPPALGGAAAVLAAAGAAAVPHAKPASRALSAALVKKAEGARKASVGGTDGAVESATFSRLTKNPGAASKARMADAGRPPAGAGAAAGVGVGLGTGMSAAGVGGLGARYAGQIGGGASGGGSAVTAKMLPLSETQAKKMGLVADGSEGKAKTKKVVKNIKVRCNRTIKNLQEAKLPGDLATLNLKLFNVAVDESVVTDYSTIVKAKMDLDTVKSRHKNARYPQVEAFFADLLPVFVNAVNYYEQGGKHRNKLVYEVAKALHTLAKREKQDIVTEYGPQVAVLRAEATGGSSAYSRQGPGLSARPAAARHAGGGMTPPPPALPSAFSTYAPMSSKAQQGGALAATSATSATSTAPPARTSTPMSSLGSGVRRATPPPSPSPPDKSRTKSPSGAKSPVPTADDLPPSPPRKKARPFKIPKKPDELARLEAARAEAARLKAIEEERVRLEKRRKAEKAEKDRAEKAAKLAAKQEAARKADAAKKEAAAARKEAAKRAAEAERARKERERLERERLEKERLEKARLEKARLEKARLEKARLEKARLERERLEKEKLERERLERERLEKERLERERVEKARVEREAAEARRKAEALAAAETARAASVKAALTAKLAAAQKAAAAAAARKSSPPSVNFRGKRLNLIVKAPTASSKAPSSPALMIFPTAAPRVKSDVLASTPGVQSILTEIKSSGSGPGLGRKRGRSAPPAKRRKRVNVEPETPLVTAAVVGESLPAASGRKGSSSMPPVGGGGGGAQHSAAPAKARATSPTKSGAASSSKAKKRKKPSKASKAGGGGGAGTGPAVAWSKATTARSSSPFRSAPGGGTSSTVLTGGADKADKADKAPPEPPKAAVLSVGVPEAGEVVSVRSNGPKKKGGGSKTKAFSKTGGGGGGGSGGGSGAAGGRGAGAGAGAGTKASGGKAGGAKVTGANAAGVKPSEATAIAAPIDPPKLKIKFNSSLVRSVSANMSTPPSNPSRPIARPPPTQETSPPEKPAKAPKASKAPKAPKTPKIPKTPRPPVISKPRATTPPTSGGGRACGKAVKGKRGKNDKESSASKAAPAAPARVSERPPPSEPRVVDKGLPPDGWGPLTTRGANGEWHKEATLVLTRLRSKDRLVNDDFLSRYAELDINLTKVFWLNEEAMPEYRALVGEPMDLYSVEKKLHGPQNQTFKCPQQFVNETIRTFTNGIVWWGQERFDGDQYAADVVMICKHLRSTFRWLCLEILPLWVWGRKEGDEPPPADPLPATDEEWEAEHLRPCPLTSREQERERLVRESKYSEIKMTECRNYALQLLKFMKKKDTNHYYWPEVDLTHYPDYISLCPFPMSLEKVEQLLGGPEDRNREYLTHGEFVRDMRLIFSNAIAYNNPSRIINELDRDASMKYYTLAKKLSAELEKHVASPYGINVVEESGRNKIVVMIDERREDNRKRLFEETVQKNREANREAELNRVEEEEAEEDRDPVEREETLRRESRQRRAQVDAEKVLKKIAEADRDNMCDAMWTMSLVHKKSILATMAETRTWGERKARWDREQAELAAASERTPAALAPNAGDPDDAIPGSHWGEAGRRSPASTRPAGNKAPDAELPPQSESADTTAIVKKARGQWAVAPAASDGGGGSHVGGGGGGKSSFLGKRKKPPFSGLSFALKGKAALGRRGRAPPPLPPAMAEAAAIAEAEEERLAGVAVAAADQQGGVGDGGGRAEARSEVDTMDVEPSAVDEQRDGDSSGGGVAGVSSEVDAMVVESPGVDSPGSGMAIQEVGGEPEKSTAAVTPEVSTIVNNSQRSTVSCSKPLLANNGTTAAGGVDLECALSGDPRLVKMRWDNGLVMVKAVIEDAAGGQGLPGINLTQSPTKLVIEALGSKVSIVSPAELRNNDGFAAACSANGVNSMKELRQHVHKLDGHLEEHARGGDESLRWVDNVSEKRLVLAQVGEILDEEYHYLPALGGVWMAAFHRPEVRTQSKNWVTGSATPTVELRVLMRRSRLAETAGVTAEDDAAYNDAAAEAVTAAEQEKVGTEEPSRGRGGGGIETVHDYLAALGHQIYYGQVREVVQGVLDGAVQEVMLKGGKVADLRDVVMWRAEESKRLRLADRDVGKPYTRMFSLLGDSDDD